MLTQQKAFSFFLFSALLMTQTTYASNEEVLKLEKKRLQLKKL